ncbi:MAG: sulfurtransferase-like selenium metabolism protein YedF [Bacillota bacterium]
MSNKLDCRGMKCPLPVIATKKALEAATDAEISVLVDNEIAKINVLKLAKSLGCQAVAKQSGADWIINIISSESRVQSSEFSDGNSGLRTKNSELANSNSGLRTHNSELNTVYLVTDNVLGNGDEELGMVLMRSLLFTISERPAPRALIFMNKGVFLTCEGSAHIETLQKISANGTEILSCGTCLDYYDLKDKLAVGDPGNMYSALELLEAFRVIKI